MAAWLLIRTGDEKKGIVILKDLIESDSYATLLVLNIIDWMGDDATALVPVLREFRFGKDYTDRYEDYGRIREYQQDLYITLK